MATLQQALKFVLDVDDNASKKFEDIGRTAKKSLGDAGTETGKFGGALDNLAQKSPIVQSALDKVGLAGGHAATPRGAALPGAALAGGAALGAFAANAVGQFQDLAGNILDFQRVSGATSDTSSRLVAVLDDYQISAEQGATAIGKM